MLYITYYIHIHYYDCEFDHFEMFAGSKIMVRLSLCENSDSCFLTRSVSPKYGAVGITCCNVNTLEGGDGLLLMDFLTSQK